MMKYAICNETFQGWTWEETCRVVAELGYDGIEIAPFTFAPSVFDITSTETAAIRATAEKHHLEIVGLHWLLVSPKGLSITSEEAEIRDKTAQYLGRLVQFCSELGGKIMVLGSPAQRRLPNGNPVLAADRLHDVLMPAVREAERHGITICLEPLPAPEADFLLTLAEARDLVECFAHPNVQTIFDVKSASSEGKPFAELIEEFAPIIAHVHANDANRRGPGFGATDFTSILSTLNKIRYQGYVSVEVFDYSPDPVTIARDSLAYLKRIEAAISQGE